jgi:hypothetical protein
MSIRNNAWSKIALPERLRLSDGLVTGIWILCRKVHSFDKTHQMCLNLSYVPVTRQIRQVRQCVIFLMWRGCGEVEWWGDVLPFSLGRVRGIGGRVEGGVVVGSDVISS